MSENYWVARLGGGASAVTHLVTSKAAWQAARQTQTSSRVKPNMVAAKCQLYPLTDIAWDIQVMSDPTYQLLVQQGMAPVLLRYDPANPKWCEMSYEGAALSKLLEHAEGQAKTLPFAFVWTVLHEVLKITCFMQYGIISSTEWAARPRDWPRMMHGDVQTTNICLRKIGQGFQIKLIDWGRGEISSSALRSHPEGQSKRRRRQEFARWSNLAHRLLHGCDYASPLHLQCACVANPTGSNEKQQAERFFRRPKREREQINAFLKFVAHRATHLDNDPNADGRKQYKARKLLQIMEHPTVWCKNKNLKILRPVKRMPRELNANYDAVNWDNKVLSKAVEAQYRANV